MQGNMKNLRWRKFIASFLAFCLLIGQCSFSSQAEENELKEDKAEIITEQQLEEESDFSEYGDESNQVTSEVEESDVIVVNIEEYEDNSKGESNYMAYVYDPTAPNYLGQPLNSNSFLDYDISYKTGDSIPSIQRVRVINCILQKDGWNLGKLFRNQIWLLMQRAILQNSLN